MREVCGDIWTTRADLRCITTNGYVKNNGDGVMGRGVAAQAKHHFPGIETALGRALQRHGNHVTQLVSEVGCDYYSFPVKHFWRDPADLKLIERSAHELARIVAEYEYNRVLLPRPGCGNGQLSWDVVRPVIEPILFDNRIAVITNERVPVVTPYER